MNQSLFLHIVERLEGFVGKLPASIQKPILSEVTPLKELFLQQRAPRFVLTGSHKLPLHEIVPAIFKTDRVEDAITGNLTGVYQWQEVAIAHHGKAAFLDARGANDAALVHVREELTRQPADLFFFLTDRKDSQQIEQREADNLAVLLAWNDSYRSGAKVAGLDVTSRQSSGDDVGNRPAALKQDAPAVADTFVAKPFVRDRLVRPLAFDLRHTSADQTLLSTLTHELPNEARIEMVRISRDKNAQITLAQMLVKSTTAICTAVGAQPIPLADLPVLTTLQLMMVSGIMYVSGRERSLRAATEFTAALGANLGAGMVLREGVRALLKFVPGWGNIVCGMVAGAGTYAIGRAATVYFIEGGSLKDAQRVFRLNRKKREGRGIPQGGNGEQPAAIDSDR